MGEEEVSQITTAIATAFGCTAAIAVEDIEPRVGHEQVQAKVA
jgi:hypothetical protein